MPVVGGRNITTAERTECPPPSATGRASFVLAVGDDPLTHFDAEGRARMVDVADKPPTRRFARARARVRMEAATCARIVAGTVEKGDVTAVARIAGIQAAKATPALVPLCHPIALVHVEVDVRPVPDGPWVDVEAHVVAVDRTGPEMEALAAATGAALCVVDMCKAMDRTLAVESVELVEKGGGRSGHLVRRGRRLETAP